jgi:hypothetical protein
VPHHIFYIVMDEITRFTWRVCYGACPTNVRRIRRITFHCSDSSQNQDTFVVTLILGMWNNEMIMKKEIIKNKVESVMEDSQKGLRCTHFISWNFQEVMNANRMILEKSKHV